MNKQLVSLKKKAKLQSWYSDIEAQKQSGLTVNEWCEQMRISHSSYYYRYRVVMQALEMLLLEKENPVEFAALPAPTTASRALAENIHIRLGDLVETAFSEVQWRGV